MSIFTTHTQILHVASPVLLEADYIDIEDEKRKNVLVSEQVITQVLCILDGQPSNHSPLKTVLCFKAPDQLSKKINKKTK